MKKLLLGALLLPVCLFATNGASDIGVGAKSKGMGGVGIALPQDAFASAFNPAGLVRVGNRGDVGLGYIQQTGFQRVYDIQTGATFEAITGKNSSRSLWFPELGLVWRYCANQSVGFAAFVRGAQSTRFEFKAFENLGASIPSRFSGYSIFFVPSWSWGITPCISVGLAINGMVQTHSNNVDYSGLDSSIAPNLPNGSFLGPGRVDTAGGVSVRGGVLAAPAHWLNLGITYQTPALMSKLSSYSGQWPDGGYWDWPSEMGAGVAVCCDSLLFSIDWVYLFWSDTTTWGNSFVFAEGQTGGFQYKTGSRFGPGFGWRDQTVWKFGFSWTPCRCLTFRGGYNFGNTPQLGEEAFLNRLTFATVQHHVTVGVSWTICALELSAYYYHGFKGRVKGRGPFFVGSSDTADVVNHQNAVGISVGGCWW